MTERNIFKPLLVRRLKNKKVIGRAGKLEVLFLRAYKNHPDRKAVIEEYQELVKDGVILRWKKKRGICISLNSRKKKQYMTYLQC